MRNGVVIAWMTIAFGILLYLADRTDGKRSLGEMDLRDAALIGFAQAMALVPGVSRAGVTMTAARFLGYSRAEAAAPAPAERVAGVPGAQAPTTIASVLAEPAGSPDGARPVCAVYYSSRLLGGDDAVILAEFKRDWVGRY
ncbi:MAG: hypothetical protein A3G81_33895 [Betaproteobacteria bacterium RIFCSPLOWO2_12_FULL_65_14]|nr:MAG: hypothetical protein A3G81_33895 [Betaproteobacteria bacterium RIFCSPLOWO2_12_FULL_65_14]